MRLAETRDGDAIARIYAPMVATTPISFEVDPPSGEQMAARVSGTLPDHPWLVAESDGVVGYAYAHRFHPRAAYDWTVETSIYVDPTHWRQGGGRRLYTALLAVLRAQGYRRAIALVTLPNPASVHLHEGMGFGPVGVYHRVGWKFGAWHDVGLWELDLGAGGGDPAAPIPVTDLAPGVLAAALAPAP